MKLRKPKLPKRDKKNNTDEMPVAANFAAADFAAPGVGAAAQVYDDNADGFDVNVRNPESGIKPLDEKKLSSWWTKDFPHELATSFALMSLFALLFAAASQMSAITFLLAGAAVYIGLVYVEEKFDSRMRLIVAAGIFAALVVAFILLRRYVWGGIGLVMNSVYDMSEASQAYLYDRIDLGETANEHPVMCVRAAAVWLSSVIGMLAALPPASARRAVGLGLAAASMIAFAYYGIIPATAVVIMIIIALVFVLARGGIFAALPVLLASLLLFGIIMLISPGENYGISRVDENFRDRFALHSAYLESDVDSQYQGGQNDPFEDDDDYYNEDDGENAGAPAWVAPLIIVLIILGALGGTGYFLFSRYKRRRDANREGIDSDDPRTAIVAMFPYAVRWLGAGDVDVSGRSFASLVEPLRHDVSDQYSNYYKSMYVLWREAAYSDHEMEEEKRSAMKEFLGDTMDMVKRGQDWRGKIRTALKYAL